MERALQLIAELDAGDILDGVLDRNSGLPEERVLKVSAASINALLGVDVPVSDMVEILNSLAIITTAEDGVLTCRIPSFRDDIEGRADLAEEVMRVYGYDHIVATPIRGELTRGKKLPERIHNDTLKSILTAHGMREIITYSFISPKSADALRLPENDSRRKAVALLNPLGEEYSVMRTQMVSSMLTVLALNDSRKIPAARMFESGKIFLPKSLPVTEQPDEVPVLCLGLYGPEEDFFTLKGIVESVLSRFSIKGEYLPAAEPFLHPGRQAEVRVEGLDAPIAVLGEVHPATAAAFGMDTRAYVAEIQLRPLFAAVEKRRVIYQPLPRFPASTRDLSVLADADTPIAELEKAIRSADSNIVEKVELFDVYQGSQIPEGKKSVSYSVVLRRGGR